MIGAPPSTVDPLCVRARLGGAIRNPPKLDALLAAVIAARLNLPPVRRFDECEAIEIPVQREPGRRFHLVSWPQYRVEAHESRYKSRRPVIAEAQMFGSSAMKKIDIATGLSKGFRIPYNITHLENDELVWYCLGDREAITDLLGDVRHLGGLRGVGHGLLKELTVEPVAPWDGFPVLRDGFPLRALPPGYPGLRPGYMQEFVPLTYPYHSGAPEMLCAVPL